MIFRLSCTRELCSGSSLKNMTKSCIRVYEILLSLITEYCPFYDGHKGCCIYELYMKLENEISFPD